MPSDYYIYNFATIDYKYYIDPLNQPVVVEGRTNTVSTKINLGSLTPTKSVNKAYATIDDLVTYTVSVANTGNTLAKNVNFRDVIPSGLTFIQGSVTINGTSYTGYNPYNSFTLGNIISGDTVVVTFEAIVTSVPNPSLVTNTANLTFSYRIDPNGSDIPVQINSNTVTTQINLGSIALTKTVDKNYATIGDILTYTVVVTNNGTVRADNVIFTDSLQSDITFNLGSVKVNGTTHLDYDPTVGFNLGNINPLDTVTVVFTVTVIPLPTHASVINYAVGTLSYKIDPNGQYYTKSYQSNTVNTIIIQPSMTVSKVVDKVYATIQNVLNYSLLIKNTGNTTISQLFFSDVLSNGASFKAGTLVIDGVSYPTYDPIAGFNMPNNIISGNTSLIQFQATVTSLPTPAYVENTSNINFSYRIDPSGSVTTKDVPSNSVTTNVVLGKITALKAVDKTIATIGDEITYTITLTNVGNVIDYSVVFQDTPSNGVTFKTGSVKVNGVSQPLSNPTTGFSLGDIGIGNVVTVQFVVTVVSVPATNTVINQAVIAFEYPVDPKQPYYTDTSYSNTVTTNISYGSLNVTKAANKQYATRGEQITYTVTIQNVGNINATNVVFQDPTPHNTMFVIGSTTINGTPYPDYNPSAGFDLGTMTPGQIITVVYKVQIVDMC
ncbi:MULTISPECIES: DUF11 domain-containing protein [Clostridium]|uniref:DUF11 domain-containing protein n=1 Tax=Clostridium TaxID=1485 RepID=UPI0003A28409|nr:MULTISPECIES: DUF11 domain-containing protein [Clostridium]MBZ5744606.1 DUF11 domain-containing protein [Clostridium butyricum]MDB2160819.1 DUF11 domain-containing protein [Clostridium butyricum]MDU1400973.1 DUF11 domain-containing protein [Clostridium sp.]MDU4926422.1 DUF11 domain-containing protein [Clostridium sp.]BBK76792.1 hypothetical protein Cbu04g_18000 [Clostridium butyricum]